MSKDRNYREFHVFGGTVVLDFCNTIEGCSPNAIESLVSPSDFDRFAFQILKLKSKTTLADLDFAIRFRTQLRALFEAHAKKESHLKLSAAIHAIEEIFSDNNVNLVLWNSLEHCERFRLHSPELGAGINSVINGFFQFYSTAELHRVKVCGNESCTHLFYDSSKSGTRQWCTMASCGNIMKARAYQARKRIKSR